MKLIKFFLLTTCVFFLLSVSCISVAAFNHSNVEETLHTDATDIGKTFYLRLQTKDMTTVSFTTGVQFDPELLKVVSVESNPMVTTDGTKWDPIIASSVDQANASGRIGFAYANSQERTYVAGDLAEITFEVIGEGTATFTLYEDSDGADGTRSDNVQTLTVELGDGATSSDYAISLVDTTDTSVSVSMVNQTAETTDGYLIAAVYDSAGRMIASNVAEGPFVPEKEIPLTVSWKATDTVAEVRAFVLDKFHMPISPKWQKELPLSQ